MERFFGVAVYVLGLIMMVTMILESLQVFDRTGPILTLAFLIFGYLLCVTGYMFARSSRQVE